MLSEFVKDLSQAIPGWRITRRNIRRVTAGVLPARGLGEADMAHRSVLVQHDLQGLFSVCGVKYTTAQRFARDTLDKVVGASSVSERLPEIGKRAGYIDPRAVIELEDRELRDFLTEEAVTCVDDFLERRIDWIVDEGEQRRVAARIQRLLPSHPRAAILRPDNA
jgi:glycerol-3-phosphate dehydrogenase